MGEGKLLGFFHFPFAICHSGCVFQHPVRREANAHANLRLKPEATRD
jgi:hypothetical protein